jgi:hypothetical protein
MRRDVLPALALCAAALLAPAARAHELGPFQVFGTFRDDGSFRLEIKVDDEHLPPAQQGGPARRTRYGPIAGLSGPAAARFGRFVSDLADSMTLSFDGAAVRPTLEIDQEALAAATGTDPGAVPARVIVNVDGWIPGGARRFTFSSSLPVRTYPLVLRCEGDDVSVWHWVAGGEVSPPFALAPRVVPPPAAAVARSWAARGFAAVLPHGPEVLLLVAAVFLLAGRPGAAVVRLATLGLGQTAGLLLALRGTAGTRLGAAGGASPPGAGAGPSPAGGLAGHSGLDPAVVASLLALAAATLAALCLLPRRHPRPRSERSRRNPWTTWASWSMRPARRLLGARWWDLVLVAAAGGVCGLDLARALVLPAPAPGGLTPPLLRIAALALGGGALGAETAAMAAALVLVGLPLGGQPWYRDRVVVPAGWLVAVVALYWSLAPLLG